VAQSGDSRRQRTGTEAPPGIITTPPRCDIRCRRQGIAFENRCARRGHDRPTTARESGRVRRDVRGASFRGRRRRNRNPGGGNAAVRPLDLVPAHRASRRGDRRPHRRCRESHTNGRRWPPRWVTAGGADHSGGASGRPQRPTHLVLVGIGFCGPGPASRAAKKRLRSRPDMQPRPR
jgi:hypothetical protein